MFAILALPLMMLNVDMALIKEISGANLYLFPFLGEGGDRTLGSFVKRQQYPWT